MRSRPLSLTKGDGRFERNKMATFFRALSMCSGRSGAERNRCKEEVIRNIVQRSSEVVSRRRE